MELVETLELLSRARRYVSEGQRCISRQRKIVDALEERGHDFIEAIIFLEQLEDMQSQYIDYCDRLERKVLLLVVPEER